MSQTRHIAPALAALLLAVGCSSKATTPGDTVGVPAAPAIEALPRSLTAGEQKLIAATNDFSFSFFQRLASTSKDSNVFTSPLSASMALGMTMNGAATATYDQMRAALGFGTTADADINDGYKSVIALLRGLDPTTDVRVANSIWYRNGFSFETSFLDKGRTYFDAEVKALDFANPASVQTINDWVGTATAGRIQKILNEIRNDHVMFLINAIYFKGSWREPFDPAQTRDAQFRGVAGNQQMRLMHRAGRISYLSTTDFELVDLPYGNTAYTMTVVLPREGKSIDAITSIMRSPLWVNWLSQLREVNMDVYLPKLQLVWERDLNEDLKTLGMRDAFVKGGADFTRMSAARGRELYIDIVKQKTFLEINEEGTTAAAVTSVGIGVTSLPPQFRVDRPFVFVIRERLSGTIMFMGKIVRMPGA